MKLHYFFRKASPVFHSIEEQFYAIQRELPKSVEYKNIYARHHSKGIIKRMLITIQTAFNQVDINHITGDIHFVALLLKKKKTILTVHDIGSVLKGSGIKFKILKYVWFSMPFKRVQYITVISEFTKKEILQKFKIAPQKIVVIPDCVSAQIKYSDYEFNVKCPNILQIGTKDNKNLKHLVPALKNISCKLTIVGKLSAEHIKLLKANNIDYENFMDLSFEEIIKLYQKSDLLTFASTYEGFGVPILEAQASGRPVITSNMSPMKEVAGEAALFVNPYSEEEITQAVNMLMKDKALREKLIQEGLKNVKKYSAKSVAEQYFQLYSKVLLPAIELGE